jgi:hypothetical protein
MRRGSLLHRTAGMLAVVAVLALLGAGATMVRHAQAAVPSSGVGAPPAHACCPASPSADHRRACWHQLLHLGAPLPAVAAPLPREQANAGQPAPKRRLRGRRVRPPTPPPRPIAFA